MYSVYIHNHVIFVYFPSDSPNNTKLSAYSNMYILSPSMSIPKLRYLKLLVKSLFENIE